MLLEFLDECGWDRAVGVRLFAFREGRFGGDAECLLFRTFLGLHLHGVIGYLDDRTTTNFDCWFLNFILEGARVRFREKVSGL